MARTLAPSIDNASWSLRPGLNRPLRRWLTGELSALLPALARSASACQADRYRKHFDAVGHGCLLLFHGLSGSPSLRQSYAAFAACSGLAEQSGLLVPGTDDQLTVSFSQLAASSSSRPAAFVSGLLPALVARARTLDPRADLPDDLHILDGTRVPLERRTVQWPTCHNGVGVQVRYVPALDLPEHVVILADERLNDYQGMDEVLLKDEKELAALAGMTLAVDLGYSSHERFRQMLDAGIHLVTRYHHQARLEVLATYPVQQPLTLTPGPRIRVQRDQRVLLGSPNNRRTTRLLTLRMVTADVDPVSRAKQRGAATVTYEILTDRWDLDADQVVQYYLWRWQIELFFRWIKRTLKMVRLLGWKSRNAVELSIWLAMVVHLLTLLAAHALGLPRRSPGLLARIRTLLPLLVLPFPPAPT